MDEIVRQDPTAHVACEVTVSTQQVHIFGEVTTFAELDNEAIARQVITDIGNTKPGKGFDADSVSIDVDLHRQSSDIARGVNRTCEAERLDSGAGVPVAATRPAFV